MSPERTGNSNLVIVLSILAILTISLVAGLLLMQKEKLSEPELEKNISSKIEENSSDEFDPISWAREGAEYPPLTEKENEDFVADYSGAKSVAGNEIPESTAILETQRDEPVKTTPSKRAEETEMSTFREVQENMYWVQVIATKTIANAERVRDDLTGMGLPVRVFTKDEGGNLIYRVRVGPFSYESEAENSANVIHEIDDFADSYVTIAPVTRYIEN